MAETIVIAFLVLSLILYAVLAGADFGAGIVEMSAPRRIREELRTVTYRAIGPVWEANHIWIILALVISFIAFPSAYALASTALHLPLSLLLLGIIVRGCAFTFRHYDAYQGSSQRLYQSLFEWSSVFTPAAFGVCAASLLLGRISHGGTFYSRFIAPWFNIFCFSVGAFSVLLCAMLAAAYLVGEADNEAHRRLFVRRSKQFAFLSIITGAGVFVAAELSGLPLAGQFLTSAGSVLCMAAATALVPVMIYSVNGSRILAVRLSAAAIVSFVLLGWFSLQFPVLVHLEGGETVTIQSAASPAASMRGLAWALVVGSCLILPALGYLFATFKWQRKCDKSGRG